ncbi:MAG: hypothetical protein RIM99_10935 [Cyclobacteriaceae bacterium]
MNKIILSVVLICLYSSVFSQVTGFFGGDGAASGYPNNGYTTNKWIKIAELTMNGNYYASGITIDFYPVNSSHGDGREHISVQFRNNNGTGLYTTTNDLTLIHFHGQHSIIKDLKAVHTAGAAVSNNKVSVWVQMGVSWLSNVPIEVRTYGNVSYEITNQPYYPAITETGTVYDVKTSYGMYSSQFKVNGTIRSKEVKVEAAPWPDYVFDDNYTLPSLEQIEKFIQSEGHLPDIPTADEVNENGIALGEMNALLLKKIEELTLYQIEMMKIINKQQARIEKLEKSKK